MEEFHGVPHPTPYLDSSAKLGDGSPQAKFVLRLARKRWEIAFPFQQTNCSKYGGVSQGTTPDPLARPLGQIGGRSPQAKFFIAIGS